MSLGRLPTAQFLRRAQISGTHPEVLFMELDHPLNLGQFAALSWCGKR
jgi:hypothetical protein